MYIRLAVSGAELRLIAIVACCPGFCEIVLLIFYALSF